MALLHLLSQQHHDFRIHLFLLIKYYYIAPERYYPLYLGFHLLKNNHIKADHDRSLIPAGKHESGCSLNQARLNRELLNLVLAGSCSIMVAAECNFEEVGRRIARFGMSGRDVRALAIAWH